MRRECQCEVPEYHGKIRPGYCRCGGWINPAWVSSDETFEAFFKQIAALPGVTPSMIEHCRQRERAGREEFGLAYLGRNNPLEGQEEGGDGGNYSFFETLKDIRAGEQEIDPDLLDAAHHFALAHAALDRRRARKGE